jgi:histidine triad (HIT) family protein
MSSVPCAFCDLLADRTAIWIAREERAAAFQPLPDSSLAPGHSLVIPTEHAPGIQDVSAQSLASTMALVQKVAAAMHAELGATGVNVLSASGPGSEQSVPHLHFHVVPRWPNDGLSTWPRSGSTKRIVGDPGAALAAALGEDR